MKFSDKPISAGLHFVSTPIGAARDVTLRALDLLAGVDMIAAEDTRTARKLMEIHGVPPDGRPVVAYHDHSDARARERILGVIRDGGSVAYVSEAGTPLIADPGFALGRAVIAEGLPVRAAPGASALLAALAVAGLPTDRFAFLGFLPSGKTQRRAALAEVAALDMTLVFYESPRRVGQMLGDLGDLLGRERPAALCRELTKRFEEVRRGTIGALAEELGGAAPKGEIVVVVGRPEAEETSEDAVRTALRQAMETMRTKDAATVVAGALGLPRREVYRIALGMGSGAEPGAEPEGEA